MRRCHANKGNADVFEIGVSGRKRREAASFHVAATRRTTDGITKQREAGMAIGCLAALSLSCLAWINQPLRTAAEALDYRGPNNARNR